MDMLTAKRDIVAARAMLFHSIGSINTSLPKDPESPRMRSTRNSSLHDCYRPE